MTHTHARVPPHVSDADHEEPAPPSGRRLTTRTGASASVHEDAITVRDAAGRLLFEYDAGTGKGSLSMPHGDLSLVAPRGSIDLVAAEEVKIGGRRISMTGERADFTFADATYRGVRLTAAVEQAHAVVDRIEQVASSVVLRARQVVRHVEGLDHTSAGRVRALIKGAYSLKAERAALIAQEEVKIDGERVHLG